MSSYVNKRLYDRSIKVYNTDNYYLTSWGYHYYLYRSGSTYYVDLSDGGDDVTELGKFDDDETAVKAFTEYMIEFEKEILECEE